MMPIDVALLRHGESESNFAKHMFESGRNFPAEEALMRVHTSERRLTPRGVAQAQAAGAWLREHWLNPEDEYRFYVSSYVRAMETAGHLGIGDDWRVDSRLVERNWGELEQKTYAERAGLFFEQLKLRKDHAFYWKPQGGEALQDVFLRSRDMTSTLHRECSQKRVLMVCHGETMWVWRTLLERLIPPQLREAMLNQTEQTRIRNCRIIEYTRRTEAGELAPRLVRMRFVNPENPNDPETNRDWHDIPRKVWTHEDLLQYANDFPCFMPAEAA